MNKRTRKIVSMTTMGGLLLIAAVMSGTHALVPSARASLVAAATDPSQLPDLGTCGQMSLGSSGPCVEALQYSLIIAGMNVVQDGQYGVQTAGAVKAFQRREGIAVDGTAGPVTIANLDQAANAPQPDRSFDGCPQLKEGITSPCMLRLRYELVAFDNSYQIPFDQTYGPAMTAAVRNYQSRNQLDVDGVVGQMTADLLDFQAGPKTVCIAQGGYFQDDGTCGSDGVTPMGKSLWDCVQELAGKDIAEAIEQSDQSAKEAGEVIPKGALREFMKKANAPAEAFKCITFG